MRMVRPPRRRLQAAWQLAMWMAQLTRGVPRSAVERVRELREGDQGLGRQPRAGVDRGGVPQRPDCYYS